MMTLEKLKGKMMDAFRSIGRFSKHEALRFEKYIFAPENFRVLLVLCAVLSAFNYFILVWAADNIHRNAPVIIPTIVGTVTGTNTPTRSPTNTSQPTKTPTTTPTITVTPPWDLAMDLYFASLPYPMRKPADQWTISPDGVKYNAFWEGYYSQPYDDGGKPGVGNCTIGYGDLLHLGPCTSADTGSISQSSAYALLEKRLNHCGSYIDDYVKVPITQNQYNAMSSLICNWGYGKFGLSEIVRLTNEGRIMEAGKVWRNTATCGINIGCGLPGLIRRRKMESHFFTSPVGVPMWPFDERKVE